MDDFPGILAHDFGFKPQGKSPPMSAAAPPRSSSSSAGYGLGSDHLHRSSSSKPLYDDHDHVFNDVFGGPPKYTSQPSAPPSSQFDYDSIFKDQNTTPKSTQPVYDKPLYDDDIFEGLPGMKSSSSPPVVPSTSSGAKFENVFASMNKAKTTSPFDDLFGNLGNKDSESKTNKSEKDSPAFDDLLPGFGTTSNRSTSEFSRFQKPSSNSTKTASNVMEDPFGVFESTSNPAVSSTGIFTDPLEEISKFSSNPGIAKVDNASVGSGVFDDIDPLESLGKSSRSTSSDRNGRGKERSPLKTGTKSSAQSFASQESVGKFHVDVNDSHPQKRMPVPNFQESHQTVFDMPNVSTDFHGSVCQNASPPFHMNSTCETKSQANSVQRTEELFESPDDVWLSVSEIPLFTQPTSAPPPARPPPRPTRVSRSDSGLFFSARTNGNDFSSFSNPTRYADNSPKSTPVPARSSIDEFEDFARGRAHNSVSEQSEVLSGDDFDSNSVTDAAAAEMEEAMYRAEAKFKHAKEMREGEHLKTARSKEGVQLNRDENYQDKELRERQERLGRERQQREEEERQQRILEKEREGAREIEKEREEKIREQRRIEKERIEARQAVERATREARGRAAVEARARAERVAVEKASTEARTRAERAAVQRAQTEARERAGVEARERAERAAAEAREREARDKARAERAAAEAREREARDKARAERAAAEARERETRDRDRARAERAAVERAAAEARERAAAAARSNQQKNDNDLESFFSMGRASSAPRPRGNSSDPAVDPLNRGVPDATRKSSVGSSSNMKRASSTTNMVDDLASIFGAAVSSSGDFQEVVGETEERRRARMERHQRTQERAAKALDDKNQRDLQALREQAERSRIGETLDIEIKRWAAGKEGNLRALLSTLQYVLWPECGWQPISLTDLIIGAAVKKAYRKATLCIHPDKVQQKGANLQQKYVAEKVFDLLKEAWNKFNSEELF